MITISPNTISINTFPIDKPIERLVAPLRQAILQKVSEVKSVASNVLKKIGLVKTAAKTQYVYHRREPDFQGNFIIPLNQMKKMENFSEIFKAQDAKYRGREQLKDVVIPSLKCLWNDVIFLSPIHPKKQKDQYLEIGFAPYSRKFFQIPIEVLKEKRMAIWKFPVMPVGSPEAYTTSHFAPFKTNSYQEMEDVPAATVKFYQDHFKPENPESYPPFHWAFIPHILCQDPIDITDKRITVIEI
jgi:hypothetical protein